MVSKKATDACRAPKKGISNSSVAWPMMYDGRKAGLDYQEMTRQVRKQGRTPEGETNAASERDWQGLEVWAKSNAYRLLELVVHVEIRCTCSSDAEVKSKCDRRDGTVIV